MEPPDVISSQLAQSTSQSNVRVLGPTAVTSTNVFFFTKNVPPGNQRVDEVPVVQTKAKMNQILSRGSTTDFGMDSMFQSSRYVFGPVKSDMLTSILHFSRQRQTLADEDAPPTSSINDIPTEINIDSSSNSNRFQPRVNHLYYLSTPLQYLTLANRKQRSKTLSPPHGVMPTRHLLPKPRNILLSLFLGIPQTNSALPLNTSSL